MKYLVFVGLGTLRFLLFLSFFSSNLYSYDSQHIKELYEGKKNMSHKDLSGADLTGLTINHKVDFSYTDFRGVILDESTFYNCTFYKANFGLNQETRQFTSMQNSYFEKCKLNFANLTYVLANNSEFVRCQLKNADCFSSCFEEAIFNAVNAKKASFINSNLSGIAIKDSFFRNVLFSESLDKKKGRRKKEYNCAVMRNCKLDQVCFEGSKLNEVDMDNSELICVDFSFCQAVNLKMRNSDLTLVDFNGSNLNYADFTDSNFYSSYVYLARTYNDILIDPNNVFELNLEDLFGDGSEEALQELFNLDLNEHYEEPIQDVNFYKKRLRCDKKIDFQDVCFFCAEPFEAEDEVAVFCCCGKTCCSSCANKALATPCFYNSGKMKKMCPFCKRKIKDYAKVQYESPNIGMDVD